MLKFNCSTFANRYKTMGTKKKSESKLHKNNLHKNGYNLEELCEVNTALKEFVFTNKYGTETIDFSNSKAVKCLNTALLQKHYRIKEWDFPDENLCPPIPGRVDYIHHLADLLKDSDISEDINVIDVGTGATCVYPLLGNSVYNWKFLGTDIDNESIFIAKNIIDRNGLNDAIQFKLQPDETNIFKGIFNENSKFSAAMCNPPFYKSKDEAMGANARKLKGLKQPSSEGRNFSGNANELWYKGGEKAFVHTFLYESSLFKQQCFWYTTLVSNKDNLQSIYASLKKLGATEVKTIPMNQGNKVTRVVAWTFLTSTEKGKW
ncbi:23S rRNA (adenine(1618)-N(6))-methyltransferase RlmF [Lutibacter oricola]|nr:23S rRNA (adenine(1618)-N(6))-methyltransferase RlmF [Lutibacter oricola]